MAQEKTAEDLQKCLGDLQVNRQRQQAHVDGLKLQIDVAQAGVAYFDTLIAATKVALGDSSVLDLVEQQLEEDQKPAPVPSVDEALAQGETRQ